jgi:hypothetical protein
LHGRAFNGGRCGFGFAVYMSVQTACPRVDRYFRIRSRGKQREKNSCEEDKRPEEKTRIQESGSSNASLFHR